VLFLSKGSCLMNPYRSTFEKDMQGIFSLVGTEDIQYLQVLERIFQYYVDPRCTLKPQMLYKIQGMRCLKYNS